MARHRPAALAAAGPRSAAAAPAGIGKGRSSSGVSSAASAAPAKRAPRSEQTSVRRAIAPAAAAATVPDNADEDQRRDQRQDGHLQRPQPQRADRLGRGYRQYRAPCCPAGRCPAQARREPGEAPGRRGTRISGSAAAPLLRPCIVPTEDPLSARDFSCAPRHSNATGIQHETDVSWAGTISAPTAFAGGPMRA